MIDEQQASSEHKELLEKVKSLSEEIELKYDEKIKSLTREQEEFDESEIDKMKEEYEELSANISAARKQGKEVFHAGNLIMKFKPKLNMYLATKDDKDFEILKKSLEDAKKEYEHAMQLEENNIKDQIEKTISEDANTSEDEEKKVSE